MIQTCVSFRIFRMHHQILYDTKSKPDDLASDTRPFTPADCQMNLHLDSNEEQVSDDKGGSYEDFMQSMDFEVAPLANDNDPNFLSHVLQGFKFDGIRNEGTKGSGYVDENGIKADVTSRNRTLSADN